MPFARCLAVLLFCAAPAAAQADNEPSGPTGLMVQAHGTLALFGLDAAFDPSPPPACCQAIGSSSSGSVAFGPGIGLGVGYGLSRVATLLVGGDVAYTDSDFFGREGALGSPAAAITLDLGARFHLSRGSTGFVPYAEAMLSRFYLLDGDDGFRGDGLSLGAGFLSSITPRLALRAGLDATFGHYDTIVRDGSASDLGIELDVTNVRLVFGLSLYPFQ